MSAAMLVMQAIGVAAGCVVGGLVAMLLLASCRTLRGWRGQSPS